MILKSDETSNVWFISDTHFNHDKTFIYEARGYKSKKEHRENVISKINASVKRDDVLVHLGDFCLNSSDVDFEETLAEIKCDNIVYLWGNHPNPLKRIYKNKIRELFPHVTGASVTFKGKELEIYPLRYKNIIFVGDYLELSVNGQFIVCSHYPLISWNKMSHDSWHLHGHIHNTQSSYKLEGKTLDVGVDFHGEPISFKSVKLHMDKTPRKIEGHH